MTESFFNFKKMPDNNPGNKKKPFLPYQGKVKSAYFYYSGLFWFLGLWVYIFSLFIIINLSLNNKYNMTNNINDINFTMTPILNLALTTISWILLLFAPQKIYQSPKQSSIMFYFSFWFLVIAIVLNAGLQINYIKFFVNDIFYNWINTVFAKLLIIFSVFSLFFVQIFFWKMRRKFAFMPSDYEIYEQRSEAKKLKKQKRQAKKLLAKKARENAKLSSKK